MNPREADLPLPEEAGAENGPAQNPLMVIHRLLKGRYKWAITLGIVGLLLGAVVGYVATDPIYRSTGAVRIRPILPKVMYSTEQSSMMPMFEGFVNSQVTLMQSRRVIDMAIKHEDWQPYAKGSVDDQVAEFTEKLGVSHRGGTEMVTIAFDDPDPQKARAAVSAIVHSYERIYEEYNSQSDGVRQQVLEQRRIALSNQLDSMQGQIAVIAGRYGAEGLAQMHALKVEELGVLEQKLNALEVARAVAEGRENQPAAGDAQRLSSQEMTVEQIAMADSAMSRLLQQKRQLEAQMEEMAQTLGSSHRGMVRARSQMASLEEAIKDRADVYRAMGGDSNSEAAGLTLDQIRDQESRVRQLYEELEAETMSLANKVRSIAGIRSEMSVIESRLLATKNRLDALDVESTVGGRIEIVSYGEMPSLAAPHQDRTAPLTVAGAGAGATAGVGLLMLVGFMDRRLQGVDDACRSTGQPPLLGVVPQLPEPSDPESLLLTGQSVHHIRTQLQIGAKTNGAQVFTIAGSSPGTGKTSLTLALGLSYAGSNHRVLLIDADLAGAALSARAGSITRHLLRGALASNGKLDQVDADAMDDPDFQEIIERGSLSDAEVRDVEELASRLDRGLPAAVQGQPLQECVAEVGPPGLSILTAGPSDDAGHAPHVSPERFRRVLDEARKHYEAILIDTGPIPGPIESSVAASEADGVVLLLARGDDRTRTEYTVEFLHSIRAKLLGLVFNRAGDEDVSVFGYSSSASTSRPTAGRTAALTRLRNGVGRSPAGVGPLVHAVMCTSRPSSSEANVR